MTAHESATTRFESPQSLCVLVEDLLPLYVEGEVSPGTRDMIANHLADCEHCAGFLAGTQSVRAQLRQEQRSRSSVIADDRPAFKTITALQFALVLFGVLGVGVFGMLVLGFTNTYGLRQLVATVIPLGALVLAAFAGLMLFQQRNKQQALKRWLSPGVVVAIGGLGALIALTQLDLILRIVGFLVRTFLFAPLYLLAEISPILGAIGMFGFFFALFGALVVVVLRRNGQSGTAE